ncbi:MAG TPA: NUDIX domain-containing protein [Chitinophagaceae bacterium]|jgi:predicted NUDIX family NTP pyrophosphohydrolase|nr:NUDIX domain-containing protein [Chitinophagaceae bacterium]
MKEKKSAGIILYRLKTGRVEVLLVHPGGPYWKNKDDGAWSIPKGEFSDEDPFKAAQREFEEETGIGISGPSIILSPVRQKSGKTVYAFAVEGDADPATIKSNSFEMEWPPGSGRLQTFPEVDKAGWFFMEAAKIKILDAQIPLLDELAERLG